MSVKTVTHRFNVWITVPAVSGDGWSKYPDYSAAEIGRMLRRAVANAGFDDYVEVEHADTTDDPS